MGEFDDLILHPIHLELQTEFQNRLTPLVEPLQTIFTAKSPSRTLRVSKV